MSRAILLEIDAERKSQDWQWGGPRHDDYHSMSDWAHFIQYQLEMAVLDASESGREQNWTMWRYRLIKVAALAAAAIESGDRVKIARDEDR